MELSGKEGDYLLKSEARKKKEVDGEKWRDTS